MKFMIVSKELSIKTIMDWFRQNLRENSWLSVDEVNYYLSRYEHNLPMIGTGKDEEVPEAKYEIERTGRDGFVLRALTENSGTIHEYIDGKWYSTVIV